MPDDAGGYTKLPDAFFDNGHVERVGAALSVYLLIRRAVYGHGSWTMGDDELMVATGLKARAIEYARRALASTEDPYIAVSGGRGRGVKITYRLVDETLRKRRTELRVLEQRIDKSRQKKSHKIAGNKKPAHLCASPHTPLIGVGSNRPRGAREELLASLHEFQIPQAAKALALDAHLLEVWAEAVVNQCHDDIQFRRYYTAQRFQAFFTSLRSKDVGIVAATLNDQLAAIENGVVFAQPFARATETIKAGGPEMRTGNLRTRRDEPQEEAIVW